jgi:ribA/ribD-fused uncharacterized protein
MKLYKSLLLEATMDLTNKRIYFWRGIFSQWAKCDIYDDILGITFNCAEQSMMWHKANTFKDEEAKEKILKVKDPREHRAIGRSIKNYDDKVWGEVRYDIVAATNYAKFSQKTEWKELLIYTDGYELVEASPYDRIWGVGLGEDNPEILDKKNWQGENLLGKAIMQARDEIIKNL